MNSKSLPTLIILLVISFCASAQLKGILGGSGKKKDSTENNTNTGKSKGSFLTKMTAKLAKNASNNLAVSTADLNTVVPMVYYVSNLHPKAVGSIDQSLYGNWKDGGNMVGIMFVSKNGTTGMNKIEGEVMIDGQAAEFNTGMYVAFWDGTSARKVEVTTASGKSTFTLSPPKQAVKIVSINGQQENASLDLSKEVVLELDGLTSDPSTPVLVSMAINTMGIKTFYQVGYFAPSNKIVISPASFRNINFPPGNTKVSYSFNGSYFKVERATDDKVTDIAGVYPSLTYTNTIADGKFITVTKEPELNTGLTATGTEKAANGEMTYSMYKPNAFISRPLTQAKSVGVTSFSIRGTTYITSSTENEALGIQVDKSATFPQQPPEVWDNILSNLYKELIPVIESELGVTVLPIEKVTSSVTYQGIEAYSKDDVNTKVEFTRAYKDTKLLSVFIPINEQYGSNTYEGRIMKETGSNVLLKITLDLQFQFNDKEKRTALPVPLMTPVLGIDVTGEQNVVHSTKYFTGTITGSPVPIPGGMAINQGVIEKDIIRKTELVAAFRKGIQMIKQKESANTDYKEIWSIRK